MPIYIFQNHCHHIYSLHGSWHTKLKKKLNLVSNSLLRYLYLHVPLKIYLGWGTHFNETACWKVKSIRIKMGTRVARWRSLVKDVALWVSSVRNKKNKKSKWSEVHHSINSCGPQYGRCQNLRGSIKKNGSGPVFISSWLEIEPCDWQRSFKTGDEALWLTNEKALWPTTKAPWLKTKTCDILRLDHETPVTDDEALWLAASWFVTI